MFQNNLLKKNNWFLSIFLLYFDNHIINLRIIFFLYIKLHSNILSHTYNNDIKKYDNKKMYMNKKNLFKNNHIIIWKIYQEIL